MSEEWEVTLKNYPEGAAIVNLTDENLLLFYNSTLIKLLSKCNLLHESSEFQGIKSSIKKVINELTVKQNYQPAKEVRFNEEILLKTLLNSPEIDQEETYFIANCAILIQIRIHNITFQNQNARLIAFADCSAAQKIEKAEAESKYKTLLISAVSHEIRTPIGAVIGTLDIIKPLIPKEKLSLLEKVKASCDMIEFHINDLTVICY